MNKSLLKSTLWILLAVFSLCSCTIEQKITKQFIKNPEEIALMLLQPDFIHKTNLKTDNIKLSDDMDQITIDSILFESSTVLKNINDSVFYSHYITALRKEFSLLGIKIYDESTMDSFLAITDTTFMVNIAQIELEEYIYNISDYELVEELFTPSFVIPLNAVSINSWFELTRLNAGNLTFPVLYGSHNINDDVKGNMRFNAANFQMQFKYKIDSLDANDIYRLADYIGQEYATYIYDYILNVYLYEHMPEGQRPAYFVHFNRKRNMIEPAYDDRFIEIDN